MAASHMEILMQHSDRILHNLLCVVPESLAYHTVSLAYHTVSFAYHTVP